MSNSEDTLQEKSKYWQALPRNNAAELAKADAYFDKEIMPWACKRFVQSQRGKIVTPYFGQILTLGTSWQPLALSLSVLCPQQVLFLGTADVKEQLARLLHFLAPQHLNYTYKLVCRSEAEAIYVAIKEQCEKWSGCGRIALDITGGTKAMASCASMAGALYDVDIYYVESKYLPLYRRPEPGSESLKRLMTPKQFLAGQEERP